MEEALLSCQGVLEAAVVAGMTRDGVTLAVAYLVLAQESKADADRIEAIRSRLVSRLPPYKRPARFQVLPELPRTATGKVQRYRLRGQVIE